MEEEFGRRRTPTARGVERDEHEQGHVARETPAKTTGRVGLQRTSSGPVTSSTCTSGKIRIQTGLSRGMTAGCGKAGSAAMPML